MGISEKNRAETVCVTMHCSGKLLSMFDLAAALHRTASGAGDCELMQRSAAWMYVIQQRILDVSVRNVRR